MNDSQPILRQASREDAAKLAELVNMAGEGMPLYLWTQMAGPGESPWDVGQSRACREEGSFSYRNAQVLEQDGDVIACLVGYPLADEPEPVDYSEMPAMFVPLQQLEDEAPGTWYLNVLATLPDHRGQGHGQRLLSVAEDHARKLGKKGISLIVASANEAARRLYRRSGYEEVATRPMVNDGWENPSDDWVLMVRSLA